MTSADEDREVIQALVLAGADLSQPRDVRHFLYVPKQKIATFLGRRIEQIGFTVETKAEGSRWLILISGIAMVTEEQIASFRETFEGPRAESGRRIRRLGSRRDALRRRPSRPYMRDATKHT